MKKLFFILTTLILFGLLSENAFAQKRSQPLSVPIKKLPKSMQKSCKKINVVPELILHTSYGELRYDFSRGRQELTQMSKKYGISESGMFTSGLATVNVNWEITLGTISRIIGRSDICIVPTSINLFIGYTDPVIYVSKDLVPDTCEYNLVMRHERTHQQINKTALDYFLPLFKNAVYEISRDVRPIHINHIENIDDATHALTQEYIKRIEPIIEAFKKEIMVEQSKLDSASQYKIEGDVCKKFNKNKR